jgi:rhodanese-related sulfurtransferase
MVENVWILVENAEKEIECLSPEELSAEIDAGTAIALDIRDTRDRIRQGIITGSIHAPRGMLEFLIDPNSGYHDKNFDPNKRYILYCGLGGQSALAAKTMQEMGYLNVGHLEPGLIGWEQAGKPIETLSPENQTEEKDAPSQ